MGARAPMFPFAITGNATAYSHLLLKAGATPSDTAYDYIAAQNGTTNAINLEAPEFKLTNYVVRVRTPLVPSRTVSP